MDTNNSQQPTSFYSSHSNKFSPKSLFVQIAFLLAVIIVFVLGLVYFNLLPASKFLNFLSFSPNKNTALKPTKPITATSTSTAPIVTQAPFVIDTTKKGEISAVSDISIYKVTLLNKQGLVDLLASWGVFSVVDNLYKTQGKTPTSNIIVHLTDKEQKGNIVTNPKTGTYLASGFVISPSSFDVYIYVLPSIVSDSSKNPSSFFQSEFVSTIYRLSNSNFSNQTITQDQIKKIEDNLTKINGTLFQNKTQFFAIEKL